MSEPYVRSQAEMRAAAEAGHEIVQVSVVIGMTCDICGPISPPWPNQGILLPEEATQYLELHHLAKHPGVPRRSKREQVVDGQHREVRSRMDSSDYKENDR